MTDHDLFATIERQRACRRFSPQPVEDATIARVLRAATFAPSAENKQPWEFVVVRDGDTRAAIATMMQRAWEDYARAFSAPRSSASLLAHVDDGMTGGFATAPVFVVVAADVERTLEVTVPSSIFPAVQNLLLAATALGLGSALTTIATMSAELSPLLGLPDHVKPVVVVPLGYPAAPLRPPSREPFEAHTHRERHGTAW